MRAKKAIFGAATIALLASSCFAQASRVPAPAASPGSDQAQLLKTAEVFVRKLFGWGTEFNVKLGPLKQSAASDFYLVPIEVTVNDRTDTGEVYISKDGKTLLRGEMFDMAADPYAPSRAKLHIEGNPVKGPADARVTLVEFGDFECPNCRELEPALHELFDRYQSKLRLVFKDFPLEQVHPWAKTAALAGRCAFMQSPDAFWKLHDSIYGNQDSITPENVWDKLNDFAVQAGLNGDAFKSCLSSPEAAQAVAANQQDGAGLNVTGTPTVFVNGRPVAGGDPNALRQLIDFELAAQPK
jgi:protein-disulfide isomerase